MMEKFQPNLGWNFLFFLAGMVENTAGRAFNISVASNIHKKQGVKHK